MNLDEVGRRTIEQVLKAGDFIIEQRSIFSLDKVEQKGHQDYVSYVDKESEKILTCGLSNILPDSAFIVEENTVKTVRKPLTWIVDPLDGTTNFIHNLPPYSISVALQYNNETILGVVYELGQKNMFYSWKGTPVYCNKQEVFMSKSSSISNGLIATGFSVKEHSRLDKQLSVVKQIVENSHGLRRFGSAATDLAYVAAGKFDGFFECNLSPWDVAAGAFLVKQAGGIVTDFKGEGNYLFGKEIIAGNNSVHKDLLKLCGSFM